MHISHSPQKGLTLPKRRLSKKSPPTLGDRFEPALGEKEKDLSDARALFVGESQGKRVAKAFGYGLALTMGLVGGTTALRAASSQQAVQDSAVQRALRNPKAKSLLNRLPSSFAREAQSLSDAQVKVLKGGMQGHTEFGPLKINNRKAFIRGHVAGKKVWPEVTKQIREARSNHKMITSSEEKQLLKVIDQASKMSKDQREVMAQLMDYVHVR